MSKSLDALIRKLREHSRLTTHDLATVNALPYQRRWLASGDDLIRQGDDPSVSAVVLSGMVARYHLLENGSRQFLSFHLSGDMPDSQALFIDKMDHAVCAIGEAEVALVAHKDLMRAFNRQPSLAYAIWRETLIDAAIFREAITNNSARNMRSRMAHLFCELFYRAHASGLTEDNRFKLAISRVQLAETLGMAIATVNRTLASLHTSRAVAFQREELVIKDWDRLVKIARFNPSYLHQKKSFSDRALLG